MPAPRSNKRKWVLPALGIFLLLCLTVAAFAWISSGSLNKYLVAAGLPAPDSAYQTGSIYGYDVYIWECYQNKRIVLWKTSSEMRSGPFERQETTCGGATPIEQKLAAEEHRARDPKRFW